VSSVYPLTTSLCLPFCPSPGDIGELDYSNLDEASKPNLRIVDRVANMTELYVCGDSVWVEQVMETRCSCVRYRVSSNISYEGSPSLISNKMLHTGK
jgi:hypothetical protein